MLDAFIMKPLAEFFIIKMLAVHMTNLNYRGKWLISDHAETLESRALLQNGRRKIDVFSYRKIAMIKLFLIVQCYSSRKFSWINSICVVRDFKNPLKITMINFLTSFSALHRRQRKLQFNRDRKERKEQKNLIACVSAVTYSLTTTSKSVPQRTRRAGVMCTADNGTPK